MISPVCLTPEQVGHDSLHTLWHFNCTTTYIDEQISIQKSYPLWRQHVINFGWWLSTRVAYLLSLTFVTQHKQMRRMSTKTIKVNRCAARSKFVKFLIMASDAFWHILFKIHILVVWKYGQKSLFTCHVVCLPHWLALRNETFNCLKHGFLTA